MAVRKLPVAAEWHLFTRTTGTAGLVATDKGPFTQGHLPAFDAKENFVDAGVVARAVSGFFNRRRPSRQRTQLALDRRVRHFRQRLRASRKITPWAPL